MAARKPRPAPASQHFELSPKQLKALYVDADITILEEATAAANPSRCEPSPSCRRTLRTTTAATTRRRSPLVLGASAVQQQRQP